MSEEITAVQTEKGAPLGLLVANASQVANHLRLHLDGDEVENGRVVLADQAEALLPERGLGLLADAGENVLELFLGGVCRQDVLEVLHQVDAQIAGLLPSVSVGQQGLCVLVMLSLQEN